MSAESEDGEGSLGRNPRSIEEDRHDREIRKAVSILIEWQVIKALFVTLETIVVAMYSIQKKS
jgi:hypothetical protein